MPNTAFFHHTTLQHATANKACFTRKAKNATIIIIFFIAALWGFGRKLATQLPKSIEIRANVINSPVGTDTSLLTC